MYALGTPGEPAEEPPALRAELDALVLLHMANIAEQARAPDGSPGTWLAGFRRLGDLLVDSEVVVAPPCLSGLTTLTADDEVGLGRAYRDGTGERDDVDRAAGRLALAAALCPVVAEPCVWLAQQSAVRGDRETAAHWARRAERRLTDLGTAWDKRLAFAEWLELARELQGPENGRLPPAVAVTTRDPRRLYEAVVHGERPTGIRSERPRPAVCDTAPAQGRFERYLEGLAGGAAGPAQMLYPGLENRPWYEPSDFSRMRAGTHIAPHRGPTNLRLRCHLGITIPAGDCAIRVGEETRPQRPDVIAQCHEVILRRGADLLPFSLVTRLVSEERHRRLNHT